MKSARADQQPVIDILMDGFIIKTADGNLPYIINPYVVAQFITAGITLVLIYRVWTKRHTRGGIVLFLMFISVLWWAVSAGFEAAAVPLQSKVLWSKISYVGAFFSPPFFLLFALFYTNRKFVLSPLMLLTLFLIPVLMISLAASNEAHGLIWSGFLSGPEGTNSLIYQHGLFFWVGMVYIFFLVSVSSLTLFVYSVKSQALYQRQNRLVMLASIFPIAGTILYVSGLNPFPGMDLVPASFMFTGLALLVGISRQKLLDVIPISHEFLVDHFDDAVLVVDEGQRIIDLNKAAEKMMHIEKNAVIGRPGAEVINLWPSLQPGLLQSAPVKFEIELPGKEIKHIQANISRLKNNRTQFMGWILVFEDITRRKQAEIELQHANEELERQLQEIRELQEKLHEQAVRDALTGVFNRGYLDTTLERELARAARKGYPLSVFMIDLDHFKQINDNYGHKVGDNVIKTTGKMLLAETRAGDCVCRFGGDEFAVVIPEMGELEARKRAEHWCQQIKTKHVFYQHETIAPTISIGIAVYPENIKEEGNLIDAADRALYAAKNAGRDCVRVYSGKERKALQPDDVKMMEE